MSSSTLSSISCLSDRYNNGKRALSDSEDGDERIIKKTRTVPEDQHGGKRDAKEKKKRQRKKKRKHSVVIVEDGHAHIKDSLHDVSSLLDATDVQVPVKAGESSNTRSKLSVAPTESLDNLLEEHDVEQIVSCPKVSRHKPARYARHLIVCLLKDKGKGKATESDPSQSETEVKPDSSRSESAEEKVARLTKELSFKNEVRVLVFTHVVVHAHDCLQLIEQHQSTYNHVQQTITCQVCLELMHKPYALSPCGHLACYDCLVSWFKAPPPDDRAALPPVTLRKKTCPHCRAVVKDRPVQIWGIKSIVSNFSKGGLLQGTFVTPDEPAPNANDNTDPWNGIFPKIGHRHDYWDEAMEGAGIEDHEDGVYRCYDCMHEIWNGLCSNCGRVYPHGYDDLDWGADIAMDNEEFAEEYRWGVHQILGNARNIAAGQPVDPVIWRADGSRARGRDRRRSESLSGEEGYESSFIDDEVDVGIHRGHRQRAPVVIITSDSEGENRSPRRRRSPVRRGTRSSRLNPIEVSDDEGQGRRRRRLTRSRGGIFSRRPGPLGAGSIVILSDEDLSDSSLRGSGPQHVPSSRRNNRARSRVDSDHHDDSDGIDP